MNMEQQQANAPPQVRNLVAFLRSSSAGMKIRVGVLNGKRHDYFKGKAAVKALMSPAYAKQKNVPPQPKSEADSITLLKSLLPYAFYLLVERGGSVGGSGSPKHLQINQLQDFKTDGYYCWFYEGSQLMTYLGGAGLVALIFAGVMFPLWPPMMRQGVWYLSILALVLLGLLLALAVVRLIIYIITVLTIAPGLWIFPNLFADVGFIDSFIPAYEWDYPKKKSKKKSKEGSSKKSKRSKEVNGETNGASHRSPYIEEVEE